jgi:hypothetical protein
VKLQQRKVHSIELEQFGLKDSFLIATRSQRSDANGAEVIMLNEGEASIFALYVVVVTDIDCRTQTQS